MSKILLVDDEESIVRVLSLSLRSDGYEVVSAFNGEQALEIFKKESPDIVLTDIKMPVMDGIELLKRVKELTDEPEVIIITGHGDIDSAIEALQYGASDFINKPIRDEALSIALHRAQDKLDIKRKLKEYTVTLEKEVEAATRELRRKTNFLSKLIRSSNDAIIATDQDFTVVIFNPGAERIFGYDKDDVVNRLNAFDIFPDPVKNMFERLTVAKKSEKEISWKETAIPSQNGASTPVRCFGTLLYEDNAIVGSVAFFHDLTEIKRLEKELVKSERLAAIGQTVAGLAHGIKNILHGLKGGSYLVDLGIQKEDTEKLKRGWDMIKRNISRTSDLVLDLLSYTKEREPEYERCRPNEIAADVCELMAEKAKEAHVEIVTDFDAGIDTVVMDPNTIHRALTNLVGNAVDACLFDENTEKHWRVRMTTAREDGAIRFEVSDNGIGMSKETLQKLFSSFFSTKGHRGTGLGLMVTRKMVEEHNGSVAVESRLGQGTTVTIRLPYRKATRQKKKTA